MRTFLTALVLAATFVAGCGEDAPEERAAKAPKIDFAARAAVLDRDPYALRCDDLSDKVASADMTRRVQYALADDAKIPGLNRLRASQSIFFAITEICKGKPGSFEPAEPAIAGVRSGEYVADLGAP
jgi:outer membrane murein-binding lipoprotein Lpp